MGIIAAIAGSVAWAVSNVLLASQVRATDALSASALRGLAAVIFLVVALFALGAAGDVGRMNASDLLQLAATGLVTLTIGEPLFVAAVAVIGMARAFTTVVGIYNTSAFLLAAILLGEEVTWDVGLGAALVLLGVYLVTLYGRPRLLRSPDAAPGARRGWRLPQPRIRPVGLGQERVNSAGQAATNAPHGSGEVRLPFLPAVRTGLGLGVTLAIAAGLVWGSGTVWLRSAAEGFDAVAATMIRLPVAAALLGMIAAARPQSRVRLRSLSRRALLVLVLSGMMAQGLAGILFIFALDEVGTGQTVVIFSASPLIALPLGALFLKERITLWVAVGTVIAVVGLALIA